MGFIPANLDAQAAIARANAVSVYPTGKCLQFVDQMFQKPPSDHQVLGGVPYSTAKIAADYVPANRRFSRANARVGMVAFFSNGNAAGHTAIINGIPTVRSTDKPSSSKVATVTIDDIINSWGGRPFRFATDWLMGHNIVNLGAPLTPATPPPASGGQNVDTVAREVIAGKWGNGSDRKARLTASGYDYSAVQARVNAILNSGSTTHPTYTVQPGDSLSGIASRLRYAGGWQALYNKNKGIIGGNPNIIRPGQVLSL
jgi:LysM repeat protein